MRPGIGLCQLTFSNPRNAVNKGLPFPAKQFMQEADLPFPAAEVTAWSGDAFIKNIVCNGRRNLIGGQACLEVRVSLNEPALHPEADQVSYESCFFARLFPGTALAEIILSFL